MKPITAADITIDPTGDQREELILAIATVCIQQLPPPALSTRDALALLRTANLQTYIGFERAADVALLYANQRVAAALGAKGTA